MKQIILVALLTLASCATTPAREIANGPTAAFGETANLDGLTVHPLELVEDSRCPALVRCVWAGRVRIRAHIGRDGIRELTLDVPASVAGGTVTLVDVRPGKREPAAIPTRSYQFTFRFEPR
jgi:hypothetical protein